MFLVQLPYKWVEERFKVYLRFLDRFGIENRRRGIDQIMQIPMNPINFPKSVQFGWNSLTLGGGLSTHPGLFDADLTACHRRWHAHASNPKAWRTLRHHGPRLAHGTTKPRSSGALSTGDVVGDADDPLDGSARSTAAHRTRWEDHGVVHPPS
jgi:hypothetical protein